MELIMTRIIKMHTVRSNHLDNGQRHSRRAPSLCLSFLETGQICYAEILTGDNE